MSGNIEETFGNFRSQTTLPVYNQGTSFGNTETGNINQANLRNLLLTYPAKPIEIPRTKLYNINMQDPMYNVENYSVDPHANQYEDLAGVSL